MALNLNLHSPTLESEWESQEKSGKIVFKVCVDYSWGVAGLSTDITRVTELFCIDHSVQEIYR